MLVVCISRLLLLIIYTNDAIYDNLGNPTGTDRSPNIDLGLNTEPPNSIVDVIPMEGTFNAMELRCVNCGANVNNRRWHSLELVEVMSVIRHWIAICTSSGKYSMSSLGYIAACSYYNFL